MQVKFTDNFFLLRGNHECATWFKILAPPVYFPSKKCRDCGLYSTNLILTSLASAGGSGTAAIQSSINLMFLIFLAFLSMYNRSVHDPCRHYTLRLSETFISRFYNQQHHHASSSLLMFIAVYCRPLTTETVEASINRIYGFYDECKRRYSIRWRPQFLEHSLFKAKQYEHKSLQNIIMYYR